MHFQKNMKPFSFCDSHTGRPTHDRLAALRQANRIPRKGNKGEAGRPGLPPFFLSSQTQPSSLLNFADNSPHVCLPQFATHTLPSAALLRHLCAGRWISCFANPAAASTSRQAHIDGANWGSAVLNPYEDARRTMVALFGGGGGARRSGRYCAFRYFKYDFPFHVMRTAFAPSARRVA